jgi:hypothetical protein
MTYFHWETPTATGISVGMVLLTVSEIGRGREKTKKNENGKQRKNERGKRKKIEKAKERKNEKRKKIESSNWNHSDSG